MTAGGKCVVHWGRLFRVLFAMLALDLTGLGVGFAQETGPALAGLNADPPAVPTAVLLSSLPQGGNLARPFKSFLHYRGQALLDREKAAAELLTGLAGLIKQVAPAPSPLATSLGVGFNGISSGESFCNCYPPDGAVAVGPYNIVGAVNTAVKVWDKSGMLLKGPTSLNNFFASNKSCLPNVSDPFASYDAAADRFLVGALTYDSSNNSSMCIGVTQTGDPTGVWYIYGFPVTPSQNFLDFPHAAIGQEATYLAGNQFQNGSTFKGARVYAYNKVTMYSGTATSAVYYNVGNNAAGHLADSLYPVQAVGVAGAYFLSADNCNGCSMISLWKWTDPFGSSSFALRGGVRVTTYSQPPNARQPGFFSGRIAANDARNLGGYWYDNTVYGTHPIGCNPGSGGVACVQWYRLGNLDTGTPTLVQQGILASNGKYRFFPNLAVDNSGNLFIGYAYSSSSDYAGIRYTGLVGGTLQPEGILKAGQTIINGGRYGDYAGTALDTNGSTIWHLEEYARSGSLWGTWVGSVCLKVSC